MVCSDEGHRDQRNLLVTRKGEVRHAKSPPPCDDQRSTVGDEVGPYVPVTMAPEALAINESLARAAAVNASSLAAEAKRTPKKSKLKLQKREQLKKQRQQTQQSEDCGSSFDEELSMMFAADAAALGIAATLAPASAAPLAETPAAPLAETPAASLAETPAASLAETPAAAETPGHKRQRIRTEEQRIRNNERTNEWRRQRRASV